VEAWGKTSGNRVGSLQFAANLPQVLSGSCSRQGASNAVLLDAVSKQGGLLTTQAVLPGLDPHVQEHPAAQQHA
jgi:hypothetical protein